VSTCIAGGLFVFKALYVLARFIFSALKTCLTNKKQPAGPAVFMFLFGKEPGCCIK